MTLSCLRGQSGERRRVPADAAAPANDIEHASDAAGHYVLDNMAAVLAVKHLGDAKSRLVATLHDEPDDLAVHVDSPPHAAVHDAAGVLSPVQRDRLKADPGAFVLAMLADTIGALHDAGVGDVVVVTPDDRVRATAYGLAAQVVSESTDGTGGLNAAYALGASTARRLWPERRWILMIQADLPAAEPQSLRQIVSAAAAQGESMVTDRAGTGTSLLLRRASNSDAPCFGPDSAAAHRAAGIAELDPDHHLWPDIRTDVDTVSDLTAAIRLGVGDRTLSVLGDL
ncbi:2-phospho-L-lactate guanylyltransferase [Gordonia otitidis]|uniref:2-phospho-L-lactate guanylyltransferase n=1 Tax=Gordonia otitidis TaxID=249058 RepID=UPI0023554FD7|nr:2-phospho-L-lactate guanylyltransferase [Gordonia otitidis]